MCSRECRRRKMLVVVMREEHEGLLLQQGVEAEHVKLQALQPFSRPLLQCLLRCHHCQFV